MALYRYHTLEPGYRLDRVELRRSPTTGTILRTGRIRGVDLHASAFEWPALIEMQCSFVARYLERLVMLGRIPEDWIDLQERCCHYSKYAFMQFRGCALTWLAVDVRNVLRAIELAKPVLKGRKLWFAWQSEHFVLNKVEGETALPPDTVAEMKRLGYTFVDWQQIALMQIHVRSVCEQPPKYSRPQRWWLERLPDD